MSDLLQRARDIAADQYIRLSLKYPTPNATLFAWADHIPTYEAMLRDGRLDHDREVQTALAALRSIAA
ncbi:hypothetical protein [Novosphingobium sp.]|uniref:hypothetical protein n=1 Tax=Novosphingobium sp. TaxID=1874826 RepID=UPI0026109642|nr:hypothetical protein [Novosphingobium sp.]